ncbi:alpha/beta hydrolase [Roseibium hamelinense]|nr:alpha/beta fold hydrolase [Roseibium hamelinense]MTI45164.1 alpha/beta hydrolase [Roseibium hamelinense]
MKISDTDILLVPGYGNTPEGHWMKRWQAKMANAWVVEQRDWFLPVLKTWQDALTERMEKTTQPVVLVGHSLGCILIAHAAHHIPKDKVVGAYLVAPMDLERDTPALEFDASSFLPAPKAPLPFRSHVAASRNDPHCSFQKAEELAKAWGATFQDAGEAGHINMASGHGPWPEGMMSFAGFMKRLG